jgi:copper chaperone CopZ
MKAFQLMFLAVFTFISFGYAQEKSIEKVVIKTPTVQCDNCKDRIERFMSKEPGVTSVKVDIKKKITTITYLTDRNGVEQLKTAIANLGYDADDIEGEQTAYKRLPKCCKKTDEKKPEEKKTVPTTNH